MTFLWVFPFARDYSFSFLGENFSQLSRKDLRPLLEIMEKKWQEKPLALRVGEKTFLLDKKKLEIIWNLSRIRNAILRGQKEIPLLLSFNEEKVKKLLQEIAQKTACPPQNATFQNQRFVRSKEGKILDGEACQAEFQEKLEKGEEEIELSHFISIPPERNTATFLTEKGFSCLLARYETSLEDREEDVIFNIQKAAAALDGLIVKKNTPFSFNQVIGKADREDGYRKTQIVVNGKLVPGYGGGVCQVSTTLYNALLQTEAQILERHPHSGYSPTTSYVPPGRDAAVSYGLKDLRFLFPDQNVVLFAYASPTQIICEIWGEKENQNQTTIETEILSLKKKSEEDGILKVKTKVIRNGKTWYSFEDTYLVPWDFGKTLTQDREEP
ncbi:MAG: VanW family protein [Candidatus Caldatribacteriaceae bacterium]